MSGKRGIRECLIMPIYALLISVKPALAKHQGG